MVFYVGTYMRINLNLPHKLSVFAFIVAKIVIDFYQFEFVVSLNQCLHFTAIYIAKPTCVLRLWYTTPRSIFTTEHFQERLLHFCKENFSKCMNNCIHHFLSLCYSEFGHLYIITRPSTKLLLLVFQKKYITLS